MERGWLPCPLQGAAGPWQVYNKYQWYRSRGEKREKERLEKKFCLNLSSNLKAYNNRQRFFATIAWLCSGINGRKKKKSYLTSMPKSNFTYFLFFFFVTDSVFKPEFCFNPSAWRVLELQLRTLNFGSSKKWLYSLPWLVLCKRTEQMITECPRRHFMYKCTSGKDVYKRCIYYTVYVTEKHL